MMAREAEEQEARINSLQFMIETNLIADPKICRGLEEYLKEKPGVVPQFKPAAVASLPGIIVSRTQETARFTDHDVFVCDAPQGSQDAQSISRTVIDILRKSGRVGQIRLRIWVSYEEVSLQKL
jgi:hypothetical protein